MPNGKRQNIQRTLSLVESGHSLQDIAQQLDTSLGTVYQYLRELGLGGGRWKYVKGQPKSNPSIEMEEAKALYESGMTIREIAERANVSQTTIHNRLRAANYEPLHRKSSQFVYVDLERVKEAYNNGKTWAEIAKDLKISTKTLRKKVKSSTINIPSRVTRVALPAEELLKEYNAGASVGQLASKYNVHRVTIIRRLKRLGANISLKA